MRHLNVAFARIWTFNGVESVLELQASAGLYTRIDGSHSRVPVGKFKIGLIAEERKPHITNAVLGDPRVHDQEWAKREGMVAFAGHPLVVGDKLVGVMAMFSRNQLSDVTFKALESVSNEIAIGIERKRNEEALEQLNEELEQRVKQRTAELDVKNRELEGNSRKFAPMNTIPGYTMTASLGEANGLILYQATRELDGLPVLLMVPATARPASAHLRRLEHEYELARDFDLGLIALPFALERFAGTAALIMKPGPTRSLASLLGLPMEIQTFLRIAIGITGALAELHRHELIHKDIKPEHVLLDEEDHVWLTGLGIASRLPRERQAPAPPEIISGTLAYMAPEQTGRMNRSIDSRSDLYSLGITFYRMLAGVLPFTASDPMEWVHCHIARQPIPPNQQVIGLPELLSEMVMKLLAKTAEERYQSAAGLDADLHRCLAEWESNGRIDRFPLGEHDVPDRLLIPEKLYGRQAEIDTLLAAFNHVLATGMPEIVLVSGYSGIGKTSVVHELHKALVPSHGLFAAGKFDQFKRDIPYATLVQALQTLIRHILGKSEAEVAEWRDALQKAVSPNGQLIVSLIPEVELIIGEQPPVPNLPPQEAQNRFQMVLRRFLGVFAGPEHPLVLFLDDLQWLDAATLDLIEQLVTGQEVRHLLLIGAYRDNEVGPTHPLMRIIDAMRRHGTGLQEIELAPLVMEDVDNLIADSLHCDRESSFPLAQLVYEKTGGNPFFAIQFLTALAEEKLLAFDAGARRWAWDLSRIHAKGYTDNVVDLMIVKLGRLPTATLEALKQFSCMGNVAEIATLSMVCGQSEEALHAALWEAVRAGLVFRIEVAYAFVHDRVQEAAYALVPEGERATAHLRIGRLLLSRTAPEDIEENIFEIANQFNRAAGLILSTEECERIAELNLLAGKRARRAAAYSSALKYFAAGDALLAEDSWQRRYALTFAFESHLAECEFLTGNLDQAEQRISELLRRAVSNIDQAAVYHLRVQLRVVKGEYMQAVDSALMCLRLFGIDFPAHPAWEQVLEEYETVWRNLDGRQIEKLIDLPLMTDPELQAAMDMLSALLPPSYFADMNLFRLAVCRVVNVSIQHGTSSPSAHGYSGLGVFLGPDFHRYHDGHLFAKLACDLVEKHSFIAHQAQINFSMGMVAYWTQPLANVIDLHRAAIRSAIETGAVTFACFSMFHLLAALLLRNDPLEAVWRESEKGLDFVRNAKYVDIADIIVSQQRFIATMQGRTANFSTFSDTQFDEAVFETQLTADRMPTMSWFYWVLKMKARFLSGDYAEALAAFDKAKALLWAAAGQTPLLDYYSYAALTVAARYVDASADEQAGWRDLLKAHEEQLREWAEIYPPTFGDMHALVSAEIAALEGRDADAMRLYEQSILSAREYGFVQNEGLALEVAARFYAARGLNTIANAYLRDAHACYVRWGAQGKVRQLEQRYPQLLEAAALAPVGIFATEVHDLDILAIIQASQAISGEIRLENLLRTLMRIVLEDAGARQGYLLLDRKGELILEATARVEQQNVVMHVRSDPAFPEAVLPASILNYVRRSRDQVLLDDATGPNPYSADEYFMRRHPKSVLCFPIAKQTRLIGLLYLENDLAAHAFTPDRLAVLELLATQAAISLENALFFKALQESEAMYRRIVDTANEGIWMLGEDFMTSFVNARMAEILGYRAEKMIGRPATDFMFEEDVSDHHRRMESRHFGVSEHYECRYRHKSGETVWSLVSATPIFDDQQHFQGSFGMLTDITARKQVEGEIRILNQELEQRVAVRTAELETKSVELHDGQSALMNIVEDLNEKTLQLEQANAKLKEVDRLKSIFIASMSHELRTPLNSIIGFSSIMLNEWAGPLNAEQKENLAVVLRSGKHLLSLINDVIDVSKIEAGKIDSIIEDFDVHEVVIEAVETFKQDIEKKGLELIVQAPRQVFHTDRRRFLQCLLNLLSNATKFTNQGSIGVYAELSADGFMMTVAVEDTGIGIGEDDLGKLFSPFVRLHTPGESVVPGTGLGLYLTQKILREILHGDILVTSTPGVGSRFTMRVPINV